MATSESPTTTEDDVPLATDDAQVFFELTTAEQVLLRAVGALDEPSGQQVKDEFSRIMGVSLNHGRLYPSLDDLVQEGFVEKGQIDRRTNSYEITEQGKKAIEDYDEICEYYHQQMN